MTTTKADTLRSTTDDEVRRLERMIWLPFGFAAFLSVVTIAPVFLLGSPDAGLTAFICFTPMTIFFVCVGQLALSKRMRQLEIAITNRAADTDDREPGA